MMTTCQSAVAQYFPITESVIFSQYCTLEVSSYPEHDMVTKAALLSHDKHLLSNRLSLSPRSRQKVIRQAGLVGLEEC